MGKVETTPYDVAEHLRTPEEIALYLEACLEEAPDEPVFIMSALADIARAKGMTQVVQDTGLTGEGNPDFATILKVVAALGLKLSAKVADAQPQEAAA